LSVAPGLRLELRPSWILALLVVAAHAAAAACAAIALSGPWGAAAGAALFLLGLATAWRVALLRSAQSAKTIEVGADGALLGLAGGTRVEVDPGARRYVSRWLVTLPVRKPRRRTVLVTPGMLDAGGYRRLRIWAIWGKLPAVAGMQLPGGAITPAAQRTISY
jgi:hypothetical protein